MSSAIGPADYGMLGALISDSASVRQNLDTLTTQASSGLIGQTYAGLGDGASTSLDLNPEIASMTTWQNNIAAATGQAGVTQTAMTQLQSIASTFYSDTVDLNGLNPSEVDSIAADAQQALVQVAGLLDTQDGGVYVFGGADTSNPPVPDPNDILSSGYYTQISSAVGTLGTNGGTATIAATLAVATSNAAGTSPFSAYMSQPAATLQAQIPTVSDGQGQSTSLGLLASANSYVASTGTSTTGSYMRDLMRSLATLASLSSSQVNDAGFSTVVSDAATSLQGVISDMAGDAGVLGDTQTALTNQATQLSDTQTALTGQVSSAQDVDMASTLSNLSLVQTQMQASYQVISGMSKLSLVNYLPT